jgi:hypothetical protein
VSSRSGGFEDCFGELVIVTGTLRFKEQAVTSTETGNVDHSSVTFFLNGTGVGQTTGAVYTFPRRMCRSSPLCTWSSPGRGDEGRGG